MVCGPVRKLALYGCLEIGLYTSGVLLSGNFPFINDTPGSRPGEI